MDEPALDLEPPRPDTVAPLALLYHEGSKVTAATGPYLAESVGEFSADPDEVRRSLTSAKTCPGSRLELAALGPLPAPSAPLDRVIAARRSARDFPARPLEVRRLASLLHHAAGVTGSMAHPACPGLAQVLRAAPSGGGLHPVETYVAAWDVAGLEPGVHHYHAPRSCLEIVRPEATRDRVLERLVLVGSQARAGAFLVLAGRWELPLRKYGERGYRVLLLDAGHLAQSYLLVAQALGLAACPQAGFHDDGLAAELGLDPREEPVLEVIAVG